MSGLPVGWFATTLSELADFNPKHDPSRLGEAVSFVPMPAVSAESGTIEAAVDKPLADVWKGFTHFAENDVIFAKITPCMENGKIAVARGLTNGLGCGSTEFHVLRSTGAVLPEFLWRFLRQSSFRNDAEGAMTGAVGQRRVPTDYLKASELPVPPLAEQRRIVAKLDALTARTARARADLDRIPALAARYKQAVLAKAFSGELTADWRLRNKVNWPTEKQPLAGLCQPDAPICYGVVQPGSISHGGIPLVRVCDLVGGKVVWPDVRTIEIEVDREYSRSRIRNGDVLVTVVGTIGRVALVSDAPDDVNIARAVARVRPNLAVVSGGFLCLALSASDVQQELLSESREVARKTLNLEQLREIAVPVPSLTEQAEIVRLVTSAFAEIDRLTAEASAARRLLDRLDQAVLAKAFRGELVPQDPADEPASILLDRIRAERAAAPKAKRSRKAALA